MAKKYIPSGYQIISIDLSGKTSGTAFTPVTEDEKILHEILSSGEIKKPILLQLTSLPSLVNATGYGVVSKSVITITFGTVGAFTSEIIGVNGNKLVWNEIEEE